MPLQRKNLTDKYEDMRYIVLYSLMLLLAACGGKSAGNKASETDATDSAERNRYAEEWKKPQYRLPERIRNLRALASGERKAPEKALKIYPKSIRKEVVGNIVRWMDGGTPLDGAYRSETRTKGGVRQYAVERFRAGIRNDTVSYYRDPENTLTEIRIRPDTLHEVLISYSSDGLPALYYETTDGYPDGVRLKWGDKGVPHRYEEYRDGRLHGEIRVWYGNGYPASVERWEDGNQLLPTENWKYSGDNNFNDPARTDQAPDIYTIEYAAEESPSRRTITEEYTLDADGRKQLARRSYKEGNTVIFNYFPQVECDSVWHDTLTRDGMLRLEIRDYCNGQLRRAESYPFSGWAFPGVPGPSAEQYSEEGELLEKRMYDYDTQKMVPVRVYSASGATVSGISAEEYARLLASCCDTQPDTSGQRYSRHGDTLVIHSTEGDVLRSGEEVAWEYNGFYPAQGIHLFSRTDEERVFYVLSDTTGETTGIFLETTPIVCAASGLLVGCNANLVYIYRILPGGRPASVATLNRGPGFYNADLEHFAWVSPHTLVAVQSKPEGSANFYNDNQAGKLPDYVRIDVSPEAIRQAKPLPLDKQE